MATNSNEAEDKTAHVTTAAVHESFPHTGKRVRQFLRPNGRKVHIAQTPEEHERLKKELHPPEDFDIYIHGTEEHAGYCLPIRCTDC